VRRLPMRRLPVWLRLERLRLRRLRMLCILGPLPLVLGSS
jgi:hypothetical protein